MDTRTQLREWFNPDGLPSPVVVPGLSRKVMAERLGKIGLTHWVEIGVADGRFASQVIESIPDVRYSGVDPYRTYRGNRRGGLSDRHERNFKSATERLAGKGRLLRMTSEEAVTKIASTVPIDVVYIDGNHDFDYVMLDLLLWSRKVRSGGVVAGHDFYDFRHAGVVPAVTAYAQANGLEWYLTDGRADAGSDKHPSFFWAVP